MAEPVRFQHFEVPIREDGSLHELGRGAMGITYKAFDTNLRSFVALKVINTASLGSEVARQRFLREARAAAALRHPNVATVFHLGEEGGDCFYAMEFVDGETVEAVMKREGTIPIETALQIVLQASRALGAAHKQGLVHRDIKPSNLMIVREEEGEFTVKVIDFGLAKNAGGTSGEDAATLTMGGFLGTPHFASPEQLDERDLDVRSDIYSLGVTLFYMLAGRAPFSGSLAQVMSQHLHREPPLESLTDQPKPVVDLLRHMLAKDPAARPQTPLDLRHEVEACLESLKSHPAPQAPSQSLDLESYETQVLEENPQEESHSGRVLADKYRLITEIRTTAFGRYFKAERLKDSTGVGILVIDPGHRLIDERVAALQKLDSPALQKFFTVEHLWEDTTCLVLEWTGEATLQDLLRTRKALHLREAIPLLNHLAAGFEAVQQAGFACPVVSSSEIALPGGDLERPLTSWPVIAAKFLPLPPDAFSAPGGLTRGDGVAREPQTFVHGLALLAYEILGGVRDGVPPGNLPSIPGLPEAANTALHRALDSTTAFDSIRAFLDALAPGRALTPASGAPTQPPQTKSPSVPLLIAIIATVLLLLGGGVAIFVSAGQTVPAPSPSPVPLQTPRPTPTPSPSPSPAPASTPDPVETTIEKAREVAGINPSAALELLLQLQKSHPENPQVKNRIAAFLSEIRDRHDSLSPGQTAALVEPLEAAAALDFVDAQLLLGEELRASDPKGALKWMLAAANNSNTEAMLLAGLMLSNDIGELKKNPVEAFKWFQRAAERGDAHAMFALGECYFYSKGVTRDPKLALEWTQRAADQGDVRALNRLGVFYSKGIPGILQPDLKKAFALFSAAKDRGYADAYSNLGALFITAPPPDKDDKMAVEIFQQGIEKGDARSMYFYAASLEQGLGGLTKDKTAARDLYRQAAEHGVAEAQEWCRQNQVPFTPQVPAPR